MYVRVPKEGESDIILALVPSRFDNFFGMDIFEILDTRNVTDSDTGKLFYTRCNVHVLSVVFLWIGSTNILANDKTSDHHCTNGKRVITIY